MSQVRTGGCQCGAIRFRVTGPVIDTSICHCRMCQKATGGLFGAYVAVENTFLEWTRGEPSRFQSSSVAKRGFCPSCGAPLTFEWAENRTALAIGCFDMPEDFAFDVAYASEKMHPTISGLPLVPASPLADTPEAESAYASMKSFQHPDHDTDHWP
jgi:hypothetical protein